MAVKCTLTFPDQWSYCPHWVGHSLISLSLMTYIPRLQKNELTSSNHLICIYFYPRGGAEFFLPLVSRSGEGWIFHSWSREAWIFNPWSVGEGLYFHPLAEVRFLLVSLGSFWAQFFTRTVSRLKTSALLRERSKANDQTTQFTVWKNQSIYSQADKFLDLLIKQLPNNSEFNHCSILHLPYTSALNYPWIMVADHMIQIVFSVIWS